MPTQGSAITLKLWYVITSFCQNFGVCDVRGQIPKSIYQAPHLLPSDFPNNSFSAHSHLNKTKDVSLKKIHALTLRIHF